MASIFTSQTPSTTNASDGAPGLTLGTAFYSGIAGNVSGVRWYFPATLPASSPIGLLYLVSTSTTGTELARKTFSSLSPGGWNNVLFDTPIAIDADTLYVAAVWTPDRYVATGSFFTADLVNGDLTAIQDATNPTGLPGNVRNGKFHVGATPAFPEDFSGSSCYFADVLFSTGFSAALGTALETDSAFSFARTKQRALGTALETDSAFSFARTKYRALGRADEIDSAGSFAANATGSGAPIVTSTKLGRVITETSPGRPTT